MPLKPGQPPSGGCVLKRQLFRADDCNAPQPPSGGFVLKRRVSKKIKTTHHQPPSGGCVLKPIWNSS